MWYLWTILFVAHCFLTWQALKQSSAPMEECHGNACMYPLLRNDPHQQQQRMWMELWTWRKAQVNSTKYRWLRVDTCRFNVTIPPTNRLPVDLTTNETECAVPIPDEARQRFASSSQRSEFRAKFRLFAMIDDTYTGLVTEIPFHLTRFVEHNPQSLWSSDSSSSSEKSSSRNLLSDHNSSTSKIKVKNEAEWVPYLKYGRAAIRVRMVMEHRPYGRSLTRNDGVRMSAWNMSAYRPIVYVDENALPRSSSIELALPEDNKPPVKLKVKLSAISPMVDAINRQVTSAFEMAESIMPGNELDELRYLVQDERLYRFFLTQIISYIHMWLDYMAFRSEIKFYRGKQSMAGVSASSVISRFVCSVIIFLYLMDGGGTSWVVMLSMFSSCAVEGWKVWRILKPQVSSSFPFVTIRVLSSDKEEETAKYDRIAMKYLGMVLYPTVAVWSIYALYQYEYKSWYSWLISNLANAVYTFGFIGMCPQLYVNYRLKSVAHLPWKVFVYKIFNTFVDDAFAWLIEMPWKHRIMTLRDDVVFLLLLVQVYYYRVDKSRTNEFGYSYEDEPKDDGARGQGQQGEPPDENTEGEQPTKLKEE